MSGLEKQEYTLTAMILLFRIIDRSDAYCSVGLIRALPVGADHHVPREAGLVMTICMHRRLEHEELQEAAAGGSRLEPTPNEEPTPNGVNLKNEFSDL
jgi:hypothetical protein